MLHEAMFSLIMLFGNLWCLFNLNHSHFYIRDRAGVCLKLDLSHSLLLLALELLIASINTGDATETTNNERVSKSSWASQNTLFSTYEWWSEWMKMLHWYFQCITTTSVTSQWSWAGGARCLWHISILATDSILLACRCENKTTDLDTGRCAVYLS